ncbi:MAG: helix-turn-helix domain-containing protein [Pseudonocardia sp.]|nr:helix-turn-helix domain-containing protein [Pseudonocardia sp.]
MSSTVHGVAWDAGGFSLAGVPEAEREELWEHVVSETHVGMSLRFAADRPRRPFHGAVRRRRVGDLSLVDAECDPCGGTRGRSRIAGSEDDLVAVLVTRSGGELLARGEAQADLRPGSLLIWESHRPARFAVRGRFAKRTLIARRTALDEVLGRGWSVGERIPSPASPAARILVDYLDVLAGADPLPPSAAGPARNAALELFAGLIRSGTDEPAPAPAPALRTAMEAWIDRNLQSGEVTPAAIAAAHGVSVRTVYRTFEPTGDTVGALVRARRLARARGELRAGVTPISLIARRWGFADSSHFSRAFKARYGRSPSDYRAEVG